MNAEAVSNLDSCIDTGLVRDESFCDSVLTLFLYILGFPNSFTIVAIGLSDLLVNIM